MKQLEHNYNAADLYDPSAGSPTETLLRLLLPLSDKVHKRFCYDDKQLSSATIRIVHLAIQSVGATGGVYKGQGRILQ